MTPLLVVGWLAAGAVGAGCEDTVGTRLERALAEHGVRSVRLTDAQVIATCRGGDDVVVDAAELERNFLGMAKTKKVGVVGRALLQACSQKDEVRARTAQEHQRVTEEAHRLGVATDGIDDSQLRERICARLMDLLPRQEPERTTQGTENTRAWGCAAPPPPPELPTGAWIVEPAGDASAKAAATFLRLDGADGGRITLRCAGKRRDLYIHSGAQVRKSQKSVQVTPAEGRGVVWKVRPSTDGQALFVTDVARAVRTLADASAVSIGIVSAQGPRSLTFATRGFSAALAELPRACR